MKLEAGKTYVFKDDTARDEYLNSYMNNTVCINHYNNGFYIESVNYLGDGFSREAKVLLIDKSEVGLFKEKESNPFDISEYKFSDDEVERTEMDGGELLLIIEAGHNAIGLNEKDAKAIAKHFKLI